MADFILNIPLSFFARVFGNPAEDPVLVQSRGVTLLRDRELGVRYSLESTYLLMDTLVV